METLKHRQTTLQAAIKLGATGDVIVATLQDSVTPCALRGLTCDMLIKLAFMII